VWSTASFIFVKNKIIFTGEKKHDLESQKSQGKKNDGNKFYRIDIKNNDISDGVDSEYPGEEKRQTQIKMTRMQMIKMGQQ
jgi:hypothetical protein